MALPGNVLVEPFQPAPFDEPDDIPRVPLTQDYELGGTALNDPSFGLQVKNWRFDYVGGDVVVAPDPYTVNTVLFTRAGVTRSLGCFRPEHEPRRGLRGRHGRMAVVLRHGAQCLHVFLELPAGTRTPFLTMDDKRRDSQRV